MINQARSGAFKWLLRRFTGLGSSLPSALSEELLYLASRTQSLDDLLLALPSRLREALRLSALHIFLRVGNEYVLQNGRGGTSPHAALPASSSTVTRMRRDRKPAFFVPEGLMDAEPDGWQMLAESSEIALLTALSAQVLLPLDGRSGLLGFATLTRDDGSPFSAAELRFLRDLGPQMGRGLETAEMISSISQGEISRARAERELEVAKEVQERLLPASLPSVVGLDIATAYRSAGQVGGDYLDLIPNKHGGVLAVVADVSGKGVPAALLMATLRASIHALLLQPDVSLVTLAEHLNTLLYQASSSNRYATLFLCNYEAGAGRLTYVNAGHNPPLLLRTDGSVQSLAVGGTVVGLLGDVQYVSETLEVFAGDTLLAYTDGVTEALNMKEREWGDAALQSAFQKAGADRSRSSQAIVEGVLQALDAFRGATLQNDDVALLALRRTGGAETTRL